MNSEKTMNHSTAKVELQLMKYPDSRTYTFSGRDYVPVETYEYYIDIYEHNTEVYMQRIRDLVEVISVPGLLEIMIRKVSEQRMEWPEYYLYTVSRRDYVAEEYFDHFKTINKHNSEVRMKCISDLEDMISSK